MKVALTIAGSDSCGGAGIQADLKTFTVLGVYGMTALTAVTAQNTLGVKQVVELDAKFVRQQIDVASSDIQVDACKTGMLANAEIVEQVAEAIKANKLMPYVCDPVIFSKSGAQLLKDDAIETVKKKLLPLCTVATPNRREAAMLTNTSAATLTSVAAAKDVAKRIFALGAKSVVVKGIESGTTMIDLFFNGAEFLEFSEKRHPPEKSHGSGCAFSAAITAGLANRLELVPAIDQAKQLVTHAIQYGDGQGRGTTPVNIISFAPKIKK